MTATESDTGDQLPDRLLTITALAKILDVNTRHVRRLVFEKRIPYIKWGHLIRFDPTEIEQWLNGARHPNAG